MFDASGLRDFLQVARDSLAVLGGGYRRRSDGDVEFGGQRPGPGWHVHGWTKRRWWLLEKGKLRRVTLYKGRWQLGRRGPTCHSRPPDEDGRTAACLVVRALKLWPWLAGSLGLERYQELLPALDAVCDRRTVRRWLERMLPDALLFQQAVRGVLIDRSEPWPVEQLFPRGLPPPEGLVRRRWRDPTAVEVLWRGLAMLFAGAVQLGVATALLLAKARGRWTPSSVQA